MLRAKFAKEPRHFRLGDYDLYDHGEVALVPDTGKVHELVNFTTDSGKKCEVVATQWGFYLGSSLNSRMRREGFRAALMLNPGNQLYVVAVEEEKMESFKEYVAENGSRILSWLDNWCAEHEIASPQEKQK